jgi:hypothetical protein
MPQKKALQQREKELQALLLTPARLRLAAKRGVR